MVSEYASLARAPLSSPTNQLQSKQAGEVLACVTISHACSPTASRTNKPAGSQREVKERFFHSELRISRTDLLEAASM